MSTEKPATDLLAAILPGLSMSQKIEQAKMELSRKKAEAEIAQGVLDGFVNKENRNKIRDQKRRDEIVGNLFCAVCVTSPDTWAEFQPHLGLWLEEASDADRTLFGLPKKKVEDVPKVDTEEGSKAAAPDAKKLDPQPEPVEVAQVNGAT